jgi:hypothetical protein
MSEAVNRGLDATHGRSQSRASRSAVQHAGGRPVSDGWRSGSGHLMLACSIASAWYSDTTDSRSRASVQSAYDVVSIVAILAFESRTNFAKT